MNAKHTPTPWFATNDEQHHAIIGSDGFMVAEVTSYVGDHDGEGASNAAHIVECVNAHDALLDRIAELEAALRECVTHDGALAERNHTMACRRLSAINEIATAVLEVTQP